MTSGHIIKMIVKGFGTLIDILLQKILNVSQLIDATICKLRRLKNEYL